MDADEERALREAGFRCIWTGKWERNVGEWELQILAVEKYIDSAPVWCARYYAKPNCVERMPTATAALMAAELMNWGRP